MALKDCTKDVIGHLASFKLSNDEGVGTEAMLLLARASKYLFENEDPFCDVMNSDTCMLNYKKKKMLSGIFSLEEKHHALNICPRHRAEFRIPWRTRKTLCAVPLRSS